MTDGQPSYTFREDERPKVPGAPYFARHTRGRKIGYFCNGVLLALLGTFANNLVTANLQAVGGEYGLYSAEASWLTVAFTAMSASSALFVIKGRQQFGIERIIKTLLVGCVVAAALQLTAPCVATALLTRAVTGFTTSTGVAMAVYYVLEVLPAAKRLAAPVIILGCLQISTPLARLVPVELLTADSALGQRLMDLAVPLIELTLVLCWPLPPTPTTRVFEWADLLSVALLAPGLILLVTVLALGRVRWWSDTPWLGWFAVFAVPLLAVGVLVELGRRNPALWIGWMTHGDMLRLAAVAFFERIAVSEQTVGAVGLLSAAGLGNDQFHGLFAMVALGMVAGILTAVLTIGIQAIPFQVTAAMLAIGLAGWLDSFSGGETRMHELLFSQMLIGFGTTLFVGPALMFGISRMVQAGPQFLLSMIMVFSFTQNVGALTGNALLSSLEYGFAQSHAIAMLDGSGRIAADANFASAQATLLATLDVFRVVVVIALAGALFVVAAAIRAHLMKSRQETA